MATNLDPTEAAARLEPTDTLGIPLGTGPAGRASWRRWASATTGRTCASTAPCSSSGTKLFNHPERPLPVRLLRPARADAARRRRQHQLRPGRLPPLRARCSRSSAPRVMGTAARPADADGWCSLSLHAGRTFDELLRAGDDPERLLVVEVAPSASRAPSACRPSTRHALHVDEIDVLDRVRRGAVPARGPAEPTDVDRAIAEHVARLHRRRRDAADRHRRRSRRWWWHCSPRATGGDYGVHSEMFTTGLMRLHQAGKVTNRKGAFDGVSVTTFAAGHERALRAGSTATTTSPSCRSRSSTRRELIAANRLMTSRSTARSSIDVHGQVVADTIGGAQYSGIGGHEDFVAGAGLELEDRSLLCLPSTVTVGGEVRSPDRALLRGRRGDHDAAPPGRRRSSPSTASPSCRARRSTSAAWRSPRSPTRTSATSCSRPPSARPGGRAPFPPS